MTLTPDPVPLTTYPVTNTPNIPNSSNSIFLLDFFFARLHERIFSHMMAENYLVFEKRILLSQFSWGRLNKPKKTSRFPKPFSIESGALLKELTFEHPVDVGVMFALTETLMFLFDQYESNKSKDLQKRLLIEEGKAFYQNMGSLRQIPYIYHLDFFSGIKRVPKEMFIDRILSKQENYGTITDPLKHLLVTFVNLEIPCSDEWEPGYGLLAIHPLSTFVYEITLRDLYSSLVESHKNFKEDLTMIRLFSDVIIALGRGTLYDDLKKSVKAALESFQLPYTETLIGRGQE